MRSLLRAAFAAALAEAGATVPPLRTEGATVVDSTGAVVRLACVNWYGAHMERNVVNGLDQQSVSDIAASIASMGFNCVRLVFSNDMYFKNPAIEAAAVSANPDLAGQSAMAIFDAVIDALGSNGVMVILNNHISDAGWCCGDDDGNGLWYTDSYPADMWQQMWVDLASRYASNKMVVGADLRNELRNANGVTPTWGDGKVATDWKLAAETCGNAVLDANSDLLIIVEGLSYSNHLLGAQVSADMGVDCTTCHAALFPVQLSVPNRLVYSGHVYSWDSEFPAKKHNGYEAFAAAVSQYQTYVTMPGQNFTAPFWLGEFGTNTDDSFWQYTIQFLQANPHFGWAYWALDGYQHAPGKGEDETYGIFQQDYKTVRDSWKLSALQSAMGNGLSVV